MIRTNSRVAAGWTATRGTGQSGTIFAQQPVWQNSPPTQSVSSTQATPFSQAISSDTADELTEMMVATVDTGTAAVAAIPGVRVAAKTGTAQSTSSRPPYAWFVSFAPADDPQVAVAVLVEASETARDEIAGGRLGGPIAKAVMEAVMAQ